VRTWYRAGRHLSPVPDDGLSDATTHTEEIPVVVRDYRHFDDIRVYPLGDVHLGSQRHDAQRWAEWLAYLEQTPNATLLGTGDFLNSAIIGSKSDTYAETETVQSAKWKLIDQLEPLAQAGRIDVLAPGNHEARIHRAVGDCPVYDAARVLKVPYVRAAVLLVYLVGDQTYEVYMRHGSGMGQSLATLAKSAMVISADAYVTGHTHRTACTADEYFQRDGDRVVRRRRYYVSSGSFMAYEDYAAERGYTPTRLGAPRMFLNGKRHEIHISV
jgi:UDP-2,3-diacylglucosamine pyrophosphatase LpxH